MKNKKADSRLLTPWFFMVLGIIAIGIFVGVSVFHSSPQDVRRIEAEMMIPKLIGAIAENGYLKEGVLEEDFNIFSKTNLNEELFFAGGDFYFNLTISEGERIKSFSKGNKDFEVQRVLSGEYLSECQRKELFILNKSNNFQKFKIEILTGSNQIGAKV